MWQFIIEGAIWLGLYILNRVTQQEPRREVQGNYLSLPRVEQGSAVPLIMGKVRVDSPILAWIGPIRESFDTTRNQSWYSADQLYVVGIPMNYNADRLHNGPRLWNMWVDNTNFGGTGKIVDKSVYGYGAPLPLRGGQWTRVDDISADNMVQGGALQFFDGQIMEGWSAGDGSGNGFEYPQELSHAISTGTPGIVTRIATSLDTSGVLFSERPSYRNYLSVALTGLRTDGATAWNLGAVAQMPGVSFEVSSYGDFAANGTGVPIGDDANPMDCLYTVLTSSWARLGWDPSMVDLASFQAASITLYNEGNGYSRAIYERTNATQIIGEILAQTDCMLYKEPTTGKLTAKLIRADYNPFTIVQFSDALSNIVEVSDYQLGAWRDTYNRVELKYTSRANDYKTMVAIASDQANQYGQAVAGLFDGKLRTLTIDMPGCMTMENAQAIAARELATVARPLAKLTIVVNRDGINVRPGDPIMINYAEYSISGVFRVAQIDYGQLFDNRVVIECLEDVFDNAGALFTSVSFATKVLLPPYLVKTQEAPYFLARLVANLGAIADADVPHTMTLAAQSGTGIGYSTKSALYHGGSAQADQVLYDLTTVDGAAGPDAGYTGDGPNTGFQWYGTVETAVNREDEPYMTSTTLRVTLVSGTPDVDNTKFVITTVYVGGIPVQIKSIVSDVDAQRQNIAQRGQFLFMVDSEIMAYESHYFDPANPNVVIFNGVWRGLLDTAPTKHAVGARVYGMRAAEGFHIFDLPGKHGSGILKPSSGVIGRTAYGIGDIADVRVCPTSTNSSLILDLGQEANDTFLSVQGRAFGPLPVADFGVSGIAVTGAAGQPARQNSVNYSTVTGAVLYKRVDGFDEGFEVSARFRDRTSTVIVRGDASDDAVLSTTTQYTLRAAIVNASASFQNVSRIQSFGVQSSPSAFHGINLSKMGHGPFDLQMRSQDLNGTSLLHRNFQTPTIRVNAKRWRNLLVNSRGDYGDMTGWTLSSGTAWTIFSNASSLSKSTTSHYFRPSASGAMYQQVDVTGFKPGGLLAIPTLYYFGGAGTDTLSVTLSFYDNTNTLISTATASNVVGGNAYWRRWDSTGGLASQPIPQNATQVRMLLTWSNASGGLFVSDVQLRVGSVGLLGFAEAFDGATTTWTNVTLNSTAGNQYVNRLVSANHNVATVNTGTDGTSPISDRIVDDCDGLEYGTAVLTFAFAQLSAGTATAETLLEVMDDTGTVLTTITTGALTAVQVGVWERHELSVDLPDNAMKFRVRLRQTGTSQLIGWDDFDLRIYSQLARSTTQGINAAWFQPKRHYSPQTWPEYYQLHPLHPAPTLVMAQGLTGVIPSTDQYDQTFAWSDGASHDPGKFTLVSGAQNLASLLPVNSTSCYHFTRTTIISGVDVELTSSFDALANFDVGQSFTCSVLFRVDELTWAGACGLVGRRGSASGWSIEIDSTGHLIAALISPDGSKTVTRSSSTVIDGAMHLACIVYDATAQLLRIHDERGYDSVSTATGLGSFALSGSPFRLGRARLLTDVLPGDVLNCVLQAGALTTAQIAELWTYGQDSNGVLTYSRSGAAWGQAYSDTDGATLARWSADQVALVYDASLSSFYEQTQFPGFGLAVQGADVNYAYTFDTTFSPRWTLEGLGTFDTTIIDPTGSPKGLRVTVNDVTAGGLLLQGQKTGSGSTLTFVFWARVIAGGPQLDLTLMASGFPNVFGTASVQLTSQWARYVVTFTGWTASQGIPVFRMRLHNDDGGVTIGYPVATWDIGHVHGIFQSNSAPVIPYLIPDPLASSATTISATATGGNHLSTEGEVAIVGVAATSSTDVPATGVEPATSAATIKQAAGGYGTFTGGWLCNDVSGNLAATIGATALVATGSPAYAQPGPFGLTDKAVKLLANGDGFNASMADVSATDDLLIVYVGRFTAAPSNFGAIVQKTNGTFANGYAITGGDGSTYYGFFAGPSAALNSTLGANYYVGRWHVGVAAIDRTNNLMRFGIAMLDDGTVQLAPSVSTVGLGTLTNAGNFAVGLGGWVGAQIGFAMGDLYVGTGSGVAAGVPSNLSNVLANLARNLNGGSIARLEVPGSLANLREIYQGFGGAPGLYHVAGDAVTGTRSQASAFTWTTPWALRGRWGRLALFEDPSLHGAGIVQADPIALGPYSNSNYATPGAFGIGTTAPSIVRIGATCQPMLIGQLTLSVSPPKIAPSAAIFDAFWDYP